MYVPDLKEFSQGGLLFENENILIVTEPNNDQVGKYFWYFSMYEENGTNNFTFLILYFRGKKQQLVKRFRFHVLQSVSTH